MRSLAHLVQPLLVAAVGRIGYGCLLWRLVPKTTTTAKTKTMRNVTKTTMIVTMSKQPCYIQPALRAGPLHSAVALQPHVGAPHSDNPSRTTVRLGHSVMPGVA